MRQNGGRQRNFGLPKCVFVDNVLKLVTLF